MSNLNWGYLPQARIWSAHSVGGEAWEIRCRENGLFYLLNNGRLPHIATPFETLRGAQSWCENSEAQPVRRLVKLYRSADKEAWVFDAGPNSVPFDGSDWECIGSAWVTEGEFADD